jgi:hypothetical protein
MEQRKIAARHCGGTRLHFCWFLFLDIVFSLFAEFFASLLNRSSLLHSFDKLASDAERATLHHVLVKETRMASHSRLSLSRGVAEGKSPFRKGRRRSSMYRTCVHKLIIIIIIIILKTDEASLKYSSELSLPF